VRKDIQYSVYVSFGETVNIFCSCFILNIFVFNIYMPFDLNIDNYTISELAQMFDLPTGYDKGAVEPKESKLKNNILNNKEIDNETRQHTINFIIKAKQVLMNKGGGSDDHGEFKEKVSDFFNSSYDLKPTKLEDPNEHMIQLRPDRPYTSSYPSEYFTGLINPLKKKTIRKQLNIDTRFRDNYYGNLSTNFNVSLPASFTNVLSMQLSAIELPTTYYNISKQYGNNYFTVSYTSTALATNSGVVFVPSGNYNVYGIVAIINAQLLLLGGLFSEIVFKENMVLGTGTGQMMVELAPATTIASFILNFQADKAGNEDFGTPLPLKLGWLLGFRNGIYENNLNYVSEGIIDMNGIRYVYLVIDDHNNNVNNGFYSAFNSSILHKNIIARISVQTTALSPNFSVFTVNNLNLLSLPRDYFGPVNLQTMNIQLLDEYGRVVDLNNMDFSFSLTLTTAYDI
jgi:hypothetical protein